VGLFQFYPTWADENSQVFLIGFWCTDPLNTFIDQWWFETTKVFTKPRLSNPALVGTMVRTLLAMLCTESCTTFVRFAMSLDVYNEVYIFKKGEFAFNINESRRKSLQI